MNVELSIVLPCYNEALNIPLILKRYEEAGRGFSFELILVNNGSTDHSKTMFEQELKNPNYSFTKVITVFKNQGYGHGILSGLLETKGEFLAFSHADMQCDAGDIFRAFQKLKVSADPRRTLIKGKRQGRELGAFFITVGMTVIASVALRMRLSDINAQPKVFHQSLMDSLKKNPPVGFEFDLYCLYQAKKNGFQIETIPVNFGKRLHGTSKWAFNLKSKVKHIAQMIAYIFKLGTK